MANMPVYDLLGGRAREAAAVYVHASGSNVVEVEDQVHSFIEKGFHHIRVQMATEGLTSNYGSKKKTKNTPDPKVFTGPKWITSWIPDESNSDLIVAHPAGIFEPKPYLRSAIKLFEIISWAIKVCNLTASAPF